MRVGVPKETMNNELRVALTPGGVVELVARGHEVYVQAGAGVGSSIRDADFESAGATVVETAGQVWEWADLILKVKEPIPSEYDLLRPGQILFTYLHLAASRETTEALLNSGVTAMAYETVQLQDGTLPLLAPMSEVAGRLAPQLGSFFLMKPSGGRGVLLGGVTATRRAQTVIIGGGTAGEQAASVALGLGSEVTVVDVSLPRLKYLENLFQRKITTRTSTIANIADALSTADLVVGSVLIPGARAPKLVTDEMVAGMKPGSVLVDIAVDQGGCFENTRPSTHDDPVYPVHNSLYYSVSNMPGAVPETATQALATATLPYVLQLADLGWEAAAERDYAMAKAVNIHDGSIRHEGVASAFPDLPADL